MKTKLGLFIRIITGIFFTLISAGALIEGQLLTFFSSMILAILTTMNPIYFLSKTKINYWVIFIAALIITLGLSYMDAKNYENHDKQVKTVR